MKHKVTYLEDDDYDLNDDIAPEYDLEKMTVVRRGFHPFMHVVPIDPEVVKFFKTPEAINEVLRRVMREMQGDAQMNP